MTGISAIETRSFKCPPNEKFLSLDAAISPTASRNNPLSNPTGPRRIACTKLKICTKMHRHRFVTPTVYTCIDIYIHIYTTVSNSKRKTEGHAIFFNPFTVCSLRKRKLSVCKRAMWTKRTCPSVLKTTILSLRRLYPPRECNKALISEICIKCHAESSILAVSGLVPSLLYLY